MTTVWIVNMHPSNYDYPEKDRQIGVFSSQDTAEKAALEWILLSRDPCAGSSCGCVWQPQYSEVTVDQRDREY